jgi:multicomponent K+:H+ antiporter subunit E
MSVALFVAWPVLASSAAPIHLVGAALLAVGIPLALRRLDEPAVVLVRPGSAIRLAFVVLWDIIRANLAVARLVLGPTGRLRPAFVEVPLDTPHRHVASLLASIVTITPGTVAVDVDEARTRILVHLLDAPDPARVAGELKARYERPLREIFGC